jgi:DHA2 family multidrug resistance protein
MMMMPVVGFLVGRTDPRYLICFGFFILSTSMILMHGLSLNSSFTQIMWIRVYQASGLAFLFIPINTVTYTGVPREQNNDVSGLTNLARNIGGSVGTAFVATMLSRGQQRHEASMVRNLTPGTPNFENQIGSLKNSFGGHGSSTNVLTGTGTHTAQAYIYNMLHRQSAMLAYMDIIAIFCVFCACMIPLVISIGKIKPPADAPAH